MTSSTGKPIIALMTDLDCCAGFQGGSVVKHLLRDGKFAIRALTRKPTSAQAKEVANLGVEVVQADFDDLPSLRRAFRGCYGVFAVTDYYDAYEREAQQGFNIVDAAKSEGIKHIIMSGADVIEGDPPMLEQKAKVAAYLRQSGVPCTVFITSFYYGNIFLLEALKRDPKTGGWRFHMSFPTDIPIPSVSPKDIGAYILAGFNNPTEWIGQDMRVANELVSPRQYAETFAEVTGMPVEIHEFTYEDFLALKNEPFILEAWTVFKWWIDQHKGVIPQVDVDLSHRLYPNRQTWREYAIEHVEVPPQQPPMLIQCYQTQEHFTENPGGKKNAP